MGNNRINKIKMYHVLKRNLNKESLTLKCEEDFCLSIRRFAPVGRGDILISKNNNVYVQLPSPRGLVKLVPSWKKDYHLKNANDLSITVKEIESKVELDGYETLTKFHYRGTEVAGRKVPLIVIANNLELPYVLGFIELTSSFLVNTARDKILNATFSDLNSGIAWTNWDRNTAKKYGNAIVRISRCVVFPEVRGLGLASVLVDAAVKYAKKRWHIGGWRPIFIEITAEMLRYWPFVKNCDFTYIGETEGNQHRMAKDMKYLLLTKNHY